MSLSSGTRLGPLMIKDIGGATNRPPSARIILVQNWSEELKRLVPTR